MPVNDWIILFVSALFVIGAGAAIGRISGELGERLGLGRAGAVLRSFYTTLPELVTTRTVTLEGACACQKKYCPAAGNMPGASAFVLVVVPGPPAR